MSSPNDITPVKTLTLLLLTDNSKTVKFQNLTSLISSEKMIKDLAQSRSLQFASANGNITIYCANESELSQFIKNLCLNHII